MAERLLRCWPVKTSDPKGAPKMIMPCSAAGNPWSPTHTSAPRLVKLGGCTPEAFQTLALPRWSWIWAVALRCCSKRS